MPSTKGLRLVEVGNGTLRSRQLYGDFLQSDRRGDRGRQPRARPSASPASTTGRLPRRSSSPRAERRWRARLRSRERIGRTPGSGRSLPGTRGCGRSTTSSAGTERARVDLSERRSSFAVDAPVEELRAAQREADVAGTRLLLVGGEGAALLLAFTILAARGMRRDLEAARRRLTWFGAQRWQLWLLGGIESAGGRRRRCRSRVARRRSRSLRRSPWLAGAPTVDVLGESVVSPVGLGLALATAVARRAARLAHRFDPEQHRRLGSDRSTSSPLAAVLVVAVVLVSGARGRGSSRERRRGRAAPASRPRPDCGCGRGSRRSALPGCRPLVGEPRPASLASRLAAVGLARGPGAAVATVAFLTIAFALALLAEGYRATLVRADREQAAFRVPRSRRSRGSAQPRPCLRRRAARAVRGAGRRRRRRAARASRGGRCRARRAGEWRHRARPRRRARSSDVGVWRTEWASGRSTTDLAALVDPGQPMELARVAIRPTTGSSCGSGPSARLVRCGRAPRSDGSFRRIELGEAAEPRSPSTLSASGPARRAGREPRGRPAASPDRARRRRGVSPSSWTFALVGLARAGAARAGPESAAQ